jgi:hypothetical protein
MIYVLILFTFVLLKLIFLTNYNVYVQPLKKKKTPPEDKDKTLPEQCKRKLIMEVQYIPRWEESVF